MFALLVHLPGDLDPCERGDRFETPLNRALTKAGRLGHCTGGGLGFRLGPGRGGDAAFLDVDVRDRAKAAPVIAAVLKAAGAPVGTLVGDHESDAILVHVSAAGPEVLVTPDEPFPPAQPRLPWRAGEVLGYRLTADRWVLLTVHGNEAKGAVLSVADWCRPALPPAADVPRLVGRPPTRYALTGRFLFPWQRVGGFEVRLTRPPMPAARRFVPTGVTVKPPRARRNGRGLVWAGPREFDRTLRELFGLVPVDGATRLFHEFGLGPGHHHLAAWDANGRATAADARALFAAHCGKEWKPAADPLRGTVPATDRTRRFVAGLKEQFRGRDVWGWGTFRAAEGFVVIPVRAADFDEVRTAAARIGRACGVAVFDPQADRLAGPARYQPLPPAGAAP